MSSINAREELVFCHECENEWNRSEFGLQCPACRSDFAQIIEPGADPRDVEPEPEPNPFQHHNPWAQAPDPDEDDIDQLQWTPSGPGGFSFSGSFYRPEQGLSPDGRQEFSQHPFMQNIQQIMEAIAPSLNSPNRHTYGSPQNIYRPQSMRGSRSTSPQDFTPSFHVPRVEIRSSSGPNMVFTSSSTTFRSAGRPPDGGNGQDPAADHIHEMLATLFGERQGGTGAPNNGSNLNPFSQFLQSVFQPNGDAVYSQEALDRVVSQLMEQHVSGNAPGPASNAAIAALPKKQVDKSMLDDKGVAECSICMEDVTAGTIVTALPCSHWFHPPCIEAWLREHDTCPHCRAGITPRDGSRNTVRSSTEEPLNNQDPFELARRQSATREHPYVVSESPSRHRRQPAYRRQSSSTAERRGANAAAGEGQEQPSDTGTGGGGITSSLRNWFGGQNGGNGRGDGR